jgi:hypothetical protein
VTKKQAANERVSAAAEETRSRRAPKESENGKQPMLHLPSPFYGIWQQRLADKEWPMLQRLQRYRRDSCAHTNAASKRN